MYTLNCKGKLLSLQKPLVMGILNVTPDSFYKGYIQNSAGDNLKLVATMLADGAGIIDIGGQSTRPGSQQISAAEETDRVIPLIELIHQNFPDTIISIDTYYGSVAAAAVHAGAGIVNDISAGSMDEAMISTVASLKVPYICMHMKGTPGTMQQQAVYEDVVKEVLDFFIEKTEECRKAGINDLIIDPGFGFGKTISHNFTLLKNLAVLKMLKRPILAGISRKSTIYKTLETTADEALNGTTVLNTISLLNGANILRVHDAKEAREAIALVEAYNLA
jgi:dihydropteroate synthase